MKGIWYYFCCRRCRKKKYINDRDLNDSVSEKSDDSYEINKEYKPKIIYETQNKNPKKKRKANTIKIEMKSYDEKNIINNYQNNIYNNNISNKNIINNNFTNNNIANNKNINNNNYNEFEIKKENIPIIIGLNNIGATCYMNATLQCLSNTDKLTKYFLNKYKFIPGNKNKIMSNEYYKVIVNLWDINNNNSSYSPNDFKEVLSKENPLFEGINANDSKDLINFLLERFHIELNNVKKKDYINPINYNQIDQTNEQNILNLFMKEFENNYNSIISNLFYGLMETKSQCQGCNIIKYNFQVYSFVEFPLEKVNEYCFKTGKRNFYDMNSNKNPDVNIYECFEYYHNIDLMTGDNRMYCNICNCLCDALYGTLLYAAPNILIINLNRGKGAVYECKVIFPEVLNLSNYVIFKESNIIFELYAVICHIGPSSMSGHFVAYCKNRIDKKWYLYNDSFVTLCQNSYDYRKGMAYILFYQVVK